MLEKTISIENFNETTEMLDEYFVTFDFYVTYIPANFSGHPDRWSPDESDYDYVIKKVILNDEEIEYDNLTEDLKKQITKGVLKWVWNCGLQVMKDDRDDPY